jgi:hypothetical protein
MPQVPQSRRAWTQISVIHENTVLTDAEVIPVIAARHTSRQATTLGLPPSPQMVYQSGRYST